MTTTTDPSAFVLPRGEVRVTVHTPLNGAVQVWGRVSGSTLSREVTDDDGPFTLTSLTLNGRVYDGRLREALLDIADMQAAASATSPRHQAIGDVLAVLTKIQPVDDGTEPPAPVHPPLTMGAVHLLSRLANAAQRGRRVRFKADGGDNVLTGELRGIVRSDSNELPPEGADPRDCWVRITLDASGGDVHLPVTDVITRIEHQEFGIDD